MLKPPAENGSDIPARSSSTAIVAAMIAEHAEPALCAHIASTIVCSASTVSHGVMAAAFGDLAVHGHVGEILRGRTC